jgi:hypothetical protein
MAENCCWVHICFPTTLTQKSYEASNLTGIIWHVVEAQPGTVGSLVGAKVGAEVDLVGLNDGDLVGEVVGLRVSPSRVGDKVGAIVGFVGCAVGAAEGARGCCRCHRRR